MTIDHAKMLSELLAVIHGDGGHFQHGQGTAVAVEVAMEIVVGLKQRQRITELERAEAASGPDERMLAVVEAAKAWCARRNEANAPTMLSILRDAVQELPR